MIMKKQKQNLLAKFVRALGFYLFATGAVFAHHSFPATYVMDETATIEGTMVQFLFRNPHSFVHVMVSDKETGESQLWAVEWGGASALAGSVDRSSLKPGDQVRISGQPGRNPEDHRIRMQSLEVIDGDFVWEGDFD
ncbi:MAG: hypothetical protein CMP91_11070 [Gammaproteobacteria bacterium]|nr:hypothetical protein [Gammaproteobacteria bacterium]|tara:strand:- start:9280 stop:9690 length:411 start_codon:yes stop_codon:yes gene_type:complete